MTFASPAWPANATERTAVYRRDGFWTAESIWDRFVRSSKHRKPGDIAVVDDRRRVSWGELHDESIRLAAALSQIGVGAGDLVAVHLPSCAEAVACGYASAALGAVFSPIPASSASQEAAQLIQRLQPAVYVGCTGWRNDPLEFAGRADGPAVVVLDRAGTGRPLAGTHDYRAMVSGASANFDAPGSRRGTPSVIAFTSGSESVPKAIVYTDEIRLFAVSTAIKRLHLGKATALMPSPLDTSSGVLNGLDFLAITAGKLVLMERWSGAQAAQRIADEGCTFIFAPATFLHDLTYLDEADRRDTSTFRLFATGGAPIPRKLVEDAEDRLGVRVVRAYGSSEATYVALTDPEDRDDRAYTADGTLLPGREVRITDDAWTPVPPGVVGHVLVRGPSVFAGYFARSGPDLSAFTEDGFVRTGDLGSLDESGYLQIAGREKDIIIRGGLNLSPSEIEAACLAHPLVADVSVVGYPDERLGERALAVIALVDAATLELPDLNDFLSAQGLSKHKLPERLELVEEVPHTATNKVDKRLLRARFCAPGTNAS
jgi:acyl-CoA synthetase (AMP-forming)/AMP-acid ligase II